MNCQTIQPLLSEFIDGTLPPESAWAVRTHVACCQACGKTVREMQALGGMLRALPARRTSPDFEARLAQRLAQATRPAPHAGWYARLADVLSRPHALRPAFALGAASLAVGGALFLARPVTQSTVAPAVSVSSPALVSHCLEQHHSDAAAQPLSDLAAQSLTAHLDSTPPDLDAGGEAL